MGGFMVGAVYAGGHPRLKQRLSTQGFYTQPFYMPIRSGLRTAGGYSIFRDTNTGRYSVASDASLASEHGP